MLEETTKKKTGHGFCLVQGLKMRPCTKQNPCPGTHDPRLLPYLRRLSPRTGVAEDGAATAAAVALTACTDSFGSCGGPVAPGGDGAPTL